jgi:hypothetical protein
LARRARRQPLLLSQWLRAQHKFRNKGLHHALALLFLGGERGRRTAQERLLCVQERRLLGLRALVLELPCVGRQFELDGCSWLRTKATFISRHFKLRNYLWSIGGVTGFIRLLHFEVEQVAAVVPVAWVHQLVELLPLGEGAFLPLRAHGRVHFDITLLFFVAGAALLKCRLELVAEIVVETSHLGKAFHHQRLHIFLRNALELVAERNDLSASNFLFHLVQLHEQFAGGKCQLKVFWCS